jgi:hypothetical protein
VTDVRNTCGLLCWQAFAGVSEAVQKSLVQAWRSESKLRKELHIVEARRRYEDEVEVLKACPLLQPLSEKAKAALKEQREARKEAGRAQRAAERAAREESTQEQEVSTAQPQDPLRRSERHSRAAYASHGDTLMLDWR